MAAPKVILEGQVAPLTPGSSYGIRFCISDAIYKAIIGMHTNHDPDGSFIYIHVCVM